MSDDEGFDVPSPGGPGMAPDIAQRSQPLAPCRAEWLVDVPHSKGVELRLAERTVAAGEADAITPGAWVNWSMWISILCCRCDDSTASTSARRLIPKTYRRMRGDVDLF
jgi:hypothetical protein